MALIYVKGDLLASDCHIIMHQCNCFKTMGAGIAKQIATKYPLASMIDNIDTRTPEERLGHYTCSQYDEINLIIGNLYGQYRYGKSQLYTDYKALTWSIKRFLDANPPKGKKVGIPYGIGCGLAGGDWTIVSDIFERASKHFNVDIYVYQL